LIFKGVNGQVDQWHLGGIPLVNMCKVKGKSAYG